MTTARPAVPDTAQDELIAAVTAGERKAIARAMAVAESTSPGSRRLVAEIHRRTGRAHVVGITGVPGAGKSTMVRALAQRLRRDERSVGIVAIDPSSPFSGGAILGDRIRMTELSGDPGVFHPQHGDARCPRWPGTGDARCRRRARCRRL